MLLPASLRVWIVLTGLVVCRMGLAESAIPLLSGFDRPRIEGTYPPRDEASLGELAKLVYRVRAVDPTVLGGLVPEDGESEVGDVVSVEGTVEQVTRWKVPEKLIEFLDLSQLFVIDVQDQGRLQRLITSKQPAGVQVGDRVAAIGVVIHRSPGSDDDSGQPSAVVSSSVQWFPKNPANVGQQLLSGSGFDLGLLPDVISRNRSPLLAEDGDAFYGMLAAAQTVSQQPELPQPIQADPVTLLRTPQDLIGQWVHIDLESVQITRVSVPESHRQEQLGSDHYYQIDAVGDLGRVVIKLENADKAIPPATFQGRFPVSLVTTDLPKFFQEASGVRGSGEAVVAQVRMKFGVDGFFFRLWGYESDFMAQHGGGQQFGPLLIASRLENQEPPDNDPAGINAIGTGAAVVILVAMGLIFFWQRRVWDGDDQARRRRQEHQPRDVQLPQ